MAYKMIAVDVDGTLLNSRGEITTRVKNAILAAVNKGLIFTICTGRPIQGVNPLIEKLEIDIPFITYNGAMVLMGISGEILYEQRMSAHNAEIIMDMGKKLNTTVIAWADNRLYAEPLNDKALEYSRISGVKPMSVIDKEFLQKGVTKIIWYDEVEKVNELQIIASQFLDESVNFHTSRPYFLEFVDSRASKAIALEKLGEHYGIGRNETIAIGDGFNDLSMIEYAGLGVAMANAPEKIRQLADYVAPSNDDDGVAFVIRKFMLE